MSEFSAQAFAGVLFWSLAILLAATFLCLFLVAWEAHRAGRVDSDGRWE